MEPPPIPQEALDKAKETLANDRPLTDDLQAGAFFDDPEYFDSLSREPKSLVCAIQMGGDHPDRPGLCHILSERFFQKYLQQKNQQELQASFALEALSLRYVLPQHPGRGKSNHHMGVLYQRNWDISKDPEDLNGAIRHYQLATEHAVETNVIKAEWFTDVGVTLNFRNRPGDFEEIERCYDRSIELSGDSPNKAMFLSNKGYFLIQSAKSGSPGYIDWICRACVSLEESVSLCKTYLTLEPRPDLKYQRIFNNACLGFYRKWDVCGDLSAIDSAIESNRLSAEQNSGGKPSWGFYRTQGQYFLDRHELTGDLDDLVKATEAAEIAPTVCGPDEEALGACKWVIGKIKRRWYQEDRSLQALQGAIEVFKESTGLLSTTSSSRALALNDLGNAYNEMFYHEAQPQYLEQSIAAYKDALASLQKTSNITTHDDVLMLNSAMGFGMLQRYLYWKSEGDLNSAISYYRRSMVGLSLHHRRYAMRAGNLSYALQLLFAIKEDPKILQESQAFIVQILDGPMVQSAVMRNWLETHLGDAFLYGESTSHSLDSVNLAIEHYDKALTDTSIPKPYQETTMANRATALQKRANLTGVQEDFETAITAYEELRTVIKPLDPLWTGTTFNQARFCFEMYNRRIGPDPSFYGLCALRDFSATASDTRADLGLRIGAASTAAHLTFDIEQDYPKARTLICCSLDLLSEAILLHETRLAQLEFVRKFHYVPSSSAALSIAAGDLPTTVINRLEAGRAVIWDRLIGLRTPLDTLRDVNKELADRFQLLQTRLAKQTVSVDKPDALNDSAHILPKDVARLQRQRDADDYRKLIQEIRSIDGLKDFLRLPEDPTGLQNYGKEAPVVFLNASGYRSDALVITKDKVMAIALPQFDMDNIKLRSANFLQALENLSTDREDVVFQAFRDYKSITKWLWYSAAKPILERIDFSAYPQGTTGKPRLLWVSTGWASILPIHAAGDYDISTEEASPSCVHDVVVSSYTTSLKALSFIRQNVVRMALKTAVSQDQKGIIVTMSSTPGMNKSLDVERETQAFEEHISPYMAIQKFPNPDSRDVKTSLTTCSLAHFACHASADWKDPSKSALLLQDRLRPDGRAKDPPPFCVRTLLGLDLNSCELVYLSACETGANRDLQLRDEGIHLASGFHMAGVPHVVSTLWRVADATSAELAGLFYGYLKGNAGGLDFKRSPDALHMAIGKLREQGEEPILWGAFSHSGP